MRFSINSFFIALTAFILTFGASKLLANNPVTGIEDLYTKSFAENNSIATPFQARIDSLGAIDADYNNGSYTWQVLGAEASSFYIVPQLAYNWNGYYACLHTSIVFDYETQNVYNITVRVTDQDGSFADRTFTINITNVNETALDISLSNNALAENNSLYEYIGSLSYTDTDAGDTGFYSIIGTDASSFFIAGGYELRTNVSFDYETKNSYSIVIRFTDTGGISYDEAFTIMVVDVNEITPNGVVAFVQPTTDQTLTENNSGFQTLPLWVEVSGATSFPVVVKIPLSGTALFGNSTNPLGDYYFTAYPTTGIQFATPNAASPTMTLTFTANGVKKINWIVYGDNAFEANETATLTLSPQTPGVTVNGTTTRTATIVNDDAMITGSLAFEATSPSASYNEGNSGYISYPVTVTLSGSNTFPIVAQISYSGSTATYGNTFGKDFHLVGLTNTQQLVFNSNGVKFFNVTILGDLNIEGNETINLTLTSPSGSTITDGARLFTIVDEAGGKNGAEPTDFAANFSLYPNPSNGQFNLSINSTEAAIAEVRIFDLNGRLILSRQNALTEGQNLSEFDLSAEPAGLYLLEIQTGDRLERVKFVVK